MKVLVSLVLGFILCAAKQHGGDYNKNARQALRSAQSPVFLAQRKLTAHDERYLNGLKKNTP